MSHWPLLPVSRRRPVASSAFVLGVVTTMAALASPAVAAPLNETEPNNDALHANGPIPPDGFVATINTSNDADYFLVRLAGRQQVKATFTRLTSPYLCAYSLREAGGTQITSLQLVSNGSTTRTWTTPRDPTEYIGSIGGYGNEGCQAVVKIEPASAIITGPLVIPDYGRTLTSSAPSQVAKSSPVTITATGVAADDEEVAVQWRTGGCPAAPDPKDETVARSSALAAGPFSLSVPTTSPGERQIATLCTWLIDSLGKLTPLLRQQSVDVDPVPPAPPIVVQPKPAPPVVVKATITSSKRLRHGRPVVVRITGATGKLQFRFTRNGKVVRRSSATIERGKASASTRKLKPGRYRVSVWMGTTRLTWLNVRIVK